MTAAAATALAWHALIAGILIGAWLTATLISLYIYLRRPVEVCAAHTRKENNSP